MTAEIDISMWDSPAQEVTHDRTLKTKALAEAAVAPLWPYLSKAASKPEFENRLALSQPSIDRMLRESVVTDPDMPVEEVRVIATDHLAQRFAWHFAHKQAEQEREQVAAALRATLANLHTGAYGIVSPNGTVLNGMTYETEEEAKQAHEEKKRFQKANPNNWLQPANIHEFSVRKVSVQHTAGDTAQVMAYPTCDVCKQNGVNTEAHYDGKTTFGPWAYMCDEHFQNVGVGLGTGKGQKLVLAPKTSAKDGDEPLWMTSTGWIHADKSCAESRRNSQGAARAPKDALSQPWAKPCKKCLPQGKTSATHTADAGFDTPWAYEQGYEDAGSEFKRQQGNPYTNGTTAWYAYLQGRQDADAGIPARYHYSEDDEPGDIDWSHTDEDPALIMAASRRTAEVKNNGTVYDSAAANVPGSQQAAEQAHGDPKPKVQSAQRQHDQRDFYDDEDEAQALQADYDDYWRSQPGAVQALLEAEGMTIEADYQYVKKRGDKWVILQKGTGKVLSHHDSEEEAKAAFRAMMSNKHGSLHEAVNVKCDGCGKMVNRSKAYIRGGVVDNDHGRADFGQQAFCEDCMSNGKAKPKAAAFEPFGIDFRHSTDCHHCSGRGEVNNGGHWSECPVCHGTGKASGPAAIASLLAEASEEDVLEAEAMLEATEGAFFHHPKSDNQPPHPDKYELDLQRDREGEQDAQRREDTYYRQHPNQNRPQEFSSPAAYDTPPRRQPHLPAGVASHTAGHPDFPHGVPYTCPQCGHSRTAKECTTCLDRAQHAHQRGPTPLDWIMHGLLPSGATAAQHEAVNAPEYIEGRDPAPCTATDDLGGTCDYTAGHIDRGWPHRFSGGDEEKRYQRAVDAWKAEHHSHGSSQHEAVNEQAYGTERYQSQPPTPRPDWITDWGDEETLATPEMTEQGMNAYVRKDNPLADTLTTVRQAALKMAGETPVAEKPLTTPPRQTPKTDKPDLVTVTEDIIPADPMPLDMGGGGGADPAYQMGSGDLDGTDAGMVDPMSPTVDQMVAARVASLTAKIIADNPQMNRGEARALAAQTVATFPQMVSVNR